MNDSPIITKEILDEAGIDIGDQDEAVLLEHLNETLQERVGAEITESLTDEELEELVKIQENGNDEEVGAWIEANVPELAEITQDEIDILLGELSENSDGINNAA